MSTEPERGEAGVEAETARREFLRKAGTYAAVTPPMVALMLSVTSKPAHASGSGAGSGKGKGHTKGRGKGHGKNGH